MTDPRTHEEIDARLQDAFRNSGLPAAPASLRDALERVPDAPVVRRSPARRGRTGGTPWGLVGLAAILAIGGTLAVAVGQRGPLIAPATPSGGPDATAPSPSVAVQASRITYRVIPTAQAPVNADDVAAIASVLRARLDATGLVDNAIGQGNGELWVDLPAGIDPGPVRRLLGRTGQVAIVPLGDTPATIGDVLDLARLDPLIDSAGISGASVSESQSSGRVVVIRLTSDAAVTFRTWTAGHIGSMVAIAVDGSVVTAPVINEEIPTGSIELTREGVTGWDATEAHEFATIVQHGPLPLPIMEVSNGPATSGSLPSPSSPVAIPVRRCEPPSAVGGDQITCDEAVAAALEKVPNGHPPIATIAVRHQCFDPDHPDTALDCLVQMFAIVDISYGDGPPDVTIGVRADTGRVLQAFVLSGPSRSGGPTSFQLNRAPVDLGCDSIMPPYRSWVFHIDPSASEPVWAIVNTGRRLRVEWGSAFRGIAGPPPLVVDDHGLEVVRDGTTGIMPAAAWPSVAGRFVCPGPDVIYVLDAAYPS